MQIRDDFVSSARAILHKDADHQSKKSAADSHTKSVYPSRITRLISFCRLEYNTRYSSKLKSGQIQPHVPEWQRKDERKQEKELRRQQEKEYQRQQREIKRQRMLRRKALERENKRREKQLKQQEKYREKQREREESLFEQELTKVEQQIQFEELLRINRDRLYGFLQWGLLPLNPGEYGYGYSPEPIDDESFE